MVTLASSVIGRSVWSAFVALLEAGSQTKVASLQGTEALFFHRLDAAEHTGRQEAVARRLDRMAALETLLTLPVVVDQDQRDLEVVPLADRVQQFTAETPRHDQAASLLDRGDHIGG